MPKRTLSEKELTFLGNIKFEERNFREAVSYFTEAIRINPDNAKSYILRADTYARQYHWMGHREEIGFRREAIKDYTLAIELAHDNANTYVKRAIARTYAGDYKKALRDLQSAQKIPCKNIIIDLDEIHYFLLVLYRGRNTPYLKKIIDKFIELCPNDFRSYKNRSIMMRSWFNRDLQEMFEDYRMVLTLYPCIYEYDHSMHDFDYNNLFNKLGKVEYKRKNYELASMYFKRVLNAASGKELQSGAYGGISRMEIKRNNYERAILYFKKAMKIAGENTFMRSPFNDIAEDLARIKCLRGEYPEAFNYINEIIEYGGPHLYYSYRHCVMRAYINMMLGRIAKASQDIADAREVSRSERNTDIKKEFIKIASTWTPDYKSRKNKIEKLIEDIFQP